MTNENDDFRNTEGFPYKKYREFYVFLVGFVIFLIGIFVGASLFATEINFVETLYIQTLSVGAIIFIFDRHLARRENRHREDDLKLWILREIRSGNSRSARRAITELMEYDWFEGKRGFLQGKILWDADFSGLYLGDINLSDADLLDAKFTDTYLGFANLENADLANANFTGANLFDTNLAGADLTRANLSNVNLLEANLANVTLSETDFSGADLQSASFVGANMDDGIFSEKTILPDAKMIGKDDDENAIYDKYWTPNTDMSRYTNPTHPDFWQPYRMKTQNEDE